jgi:hypothetical protein
MPRGLMGAHLPGPPNDIKELLNLIQAIIVSLQASSAAMVERQQPCAMSFYSDIKLVPIFLNHKPSLKHGNMSLRLNAHLDRLRG